MNALAHFAMSGKSADGKEINVIPKGGGHRSDDAVCGQLASELPGSHKGRAEVLKNFNQRTFLSLLERWLLQFFCSRRHPAVSRL